MSIEKKTIGLKQLTKAHSKPVKLAKGGKAFVADNKKQRKYKVKGES
jgi:hypothetical protein